MRTRLVRGPGVDGGQASTLIAMATFAAAMALVFLVVSAVNEESPFTTFLSGDSWAATALGNDDADLPATTTDASAIRESGTPILPQLGDGPIGDPATTSPLVALALLVTAVALPIAARAAIDPRPAAG